MMIGSEKLVADSALKGPYLVVLPHSLDMLPLHQCQLILKILSGDISLW